MNKSESKNYYELLGVDRTASVDEIKQAFKDIVIVYHPDSNFFSEIVGDTSNSPEEIALFKEITQAYQTLINKDKREEYDRSLNKEELARGVQTTDFWIRPDGTSPKERPRGREKQPTITDLQKYQRQYKERQMQQMQKIKTATVAEIMEDTQKEKKLTMVIMIWSGALVFFVILLGVVFFL
jgi:DnaJ-class molecular chaperone